jgi:uncharacterized protein YceK
MKKLTLLSVLAALLLAGCASTSSSTTGSGSADLAWADPKAVALWKCLTEKWAVFYGTERCSHCKNQKSLFGAAMPVVPFVDCDKEKLKCTTAWIQWYPTWVFADGSKAEWTQQLAVLAQKANCAY